MSATMSKKLTDLLKDGGHFVAPGVYDALTALLVEQTGFDACYLSGASVSYTQLGRPDLGMVSLSQVADTVARITDRVSIPIIVDADTGFGNAVNVQHTIKTLEKAGAGGIQLEDQILPKRCGHLNGKELVCLSEMAGKVKAAVDARRDENTLIIARTDGIAVEGIDRALERAHAYKVAGADILFVEAPQSIDQMKRIANAFKGEMPLLANMVEGGKTPISGTGELAEIGFQVIITPGSLVRAMAFAAKDMLSALHDTGSTKPMADRMFNFNQLNEHLGLQDLLDVGEVYGPVEQKAAE